MIEEFRQRAFPREVRILQDSLEGRLRDVNLLRWLLQKCQNPRVLENLGIELRQQGIPVETHWVKEIILQGIVAINVKFARITYG